MRIMLAQTRRDGFNIHSFQSSFNFCIHRNAGVVFIHHFKREVFEHERRMSR